MPDEIFRLFHLDPNRRSASLGRQEHKQTFCALRARALWGFGMGDPGSLRTKANEFCEIFSLKLEKTEGTNGSLFEKREIAPQKS